MHLQLFGDKFLSINIHINSEVYKMSVDKYLETDHWEGCDTLIKTELEEEHSLCSNPEVQSATETTFIYFE